MSLLSPVLLVSPFKIISLMVFMTNSFYILVIFTLITLQII